MVGPRAPRHASPGGGGRGRQLRALCGRGRGRPRPQQVLGAEQLHLGGAAAAAHHPRQRHLHAGAARRGVCRVPVKTAGSCTGTVTKSRKEIPPFQQRLT